MNQLNKWVNVKSFWFTFIGLMLIKYGYYGFEYFPVLDDWIQYGGYPFYPDIFQDVILEMKTYTARPLASLSDPYIWGQFWGMMGIPFLIITLLHAASGYFLYKVLAAQKLFVGMPFLVVYGLLPLGSEATYWISASSRIVVGVFWMALALFLLSLYVDNGKKGYLWAFFATHLFSLGYYEQVLVLSCSCAVLLLLGNWKRLRSKWVLGIPFFNFGVIVLYYRVFGSMGNVAQRGQMVKSDYISHFMLVYDKVTDIWGRVQIPLLSNGLRRGLEVLVENRSYLFLALIVCISAAAAVFSLKKVWTSAPGARHEPKSPVKMHSVQIVLGGLLFWIPFAPNFLLETVWICNRNAFTSFIGLGLAVEGVLGLVFRGKIGTYLKAAGVLVVTFVFLIVNVSEITDYKRASEIDREICTNILEAVDDPAFFEGQREVIVLNAQSAYMEQNSYHNDHIHNITSSDWALTGGLRAVAQNVRIKTLIMQCYPGSGIKMDPQAWDTAIILGIEEDLSVVPLSVKQKTDGEVLLSETTGEHFGKALLDNKGRYVFGR
ncbi:MAG: hypothetical protein MJB12_01885 [Firmicutes bacterium]|nr:hypothetical protein [Bacillota bacterium]